MTPVLILLVALLCLLSGLAAWLHWTAGVRLRFVRDFLYLFAVLAVAIGIMKLSAKVWRPQQLDLISEMPARWKAAPETEEQAETA